MSATQRALGPHITVWFGHEQGKYPDGNSVVVRGTSGSVVIDPSLSVHRASPALSVDAVLLTHAHEDHVAGVSAVAAGSVHVHHADLPALQSVDGLMRLYGLDEGDWPTMTQLVTERFHFVGWPEALGFGDGEVWHLGGVTVTAVHAPGHTAGHTMFLIESDDGTRVVVTGDIDLSTFGPYYGDAASSLADFEATLAMAHELHADHYVTFHHKGVIDGFDDFRTAVEAYQAVFGRRTESLLALLAERRTVDELVDIGIVYRAGTRPAVFGTSVERRTIRQHLDRAVADGAVVTDGREYWAA
jgi:glyoxylase-like metal-dependent hydrolase (beta-lactamase superfamily II)